MPGEWRLITKVLGGAVVITRGRDLELVELTSRCLNAERANVELAPEPPSVWAAVSVDHELLALRGSCWVSGQMHPIEILLTKQVSLLTCTRKMKFLHTPTQRQFKLTLYF